MKQWKIICITLLGICACGLTALLIYAGFVFGRGGSFWQIGGGRLEGLAENEIDAAEADRIVLDFDHAPCDLALYRNGTEQLRVKENYSTYGKEFLPSELSEEDGVVTVSGRDRRSRRGFWLFGNPGSYTRTEIYLPASFEGELEIRNTSGEIWNEDALQLKSLACDMTSGDLELRQVNAGELEVNLTSGNVFYSGESLAGVISATSGNLELQADRLSGDLQIDVTSGDVELELGRDAAFLLEGRVSSGDIDTDFEDEVYYQDSDRRNRIRGEVGENPVYRLDVNATSGDIDISRR